MTHVTHPTVVFSVEQGQGHVHRDPLRLSPHVWPQGVARHQPLRRLDRRRRGLRSRLGVQARGNASAVFPFPIHGIWALRLTCSRAWCLSPGMCSTSSRSRTSATAGSGLARRGACTSLSFCSGTYPLPPRSGAQTNLLTPSTFCSLIFAAVHTTYVSIVASRAGAAHDSPHASERRCRPAPAFRLAWLRMTAPSSPNGCCASSR